MLKYFLFIYLLVFFGTAFVWRSYMVWRHTGVNPYKLGNSESAHDFIGRLFRLTNVAVFVVVCTYTFSDTLYSYLVPITWLIHPALVMSGWLLLGIALIWVLIAQLQMGDSWRIGIDSDTQTALIRHGIFARSRNPIFLGMQVMLAGLLLVIPNAATLVTCVLGIVLMQIQVRLEEEHLEQLHGDDYQAYRRQVRRWF
ncbi:MAG TPA: isoprenylcysteine carboxylmethyltransferase family protein [Caldilineaceae bacterium]|nr:isoprenylcysteine carboxylmethyltransferase family protein [Caldilineaceae bacterium]